MVVEKRKQVLQQLLNQQEANALPIFNLQPMQLLPFFRKIEAQVLAQAKSTAVVYWSSNDANWMLAQRAEFLSFKQSTTCTSIFSDYLDDNRDEFCFLVLSHGASIVVYGSRNDDRSYQCAGSIDPKRVEKVYRELNPFWQYCDPPEADRLDRALRTAGTATSAPIFANAAVQEWCVITGGAVAQPTQKQECFIPTHNASAVVSEQSVSSTAQAQSRTKEDEFWMRIANNYPYPLAYSYRILESITSPSEKYKEQFRFIENLLALLASLSLAISAQREPKLVADVKECILYGVSVGHWRELIRKCTVLWKESPAKEIPLAKAITELRIEQTSKGFGKVVEQLIRARNDFAHHRGPVAESHLAREAQKQSELLREGMDYVGSLCDFPIKLIKEIDVLPSSTIKYTCLKLAGDHPALKQEELCLNIGFPKGHLIVNSGDGKWLSLYPFLAQETCSLCGSMEIYHLDKWKFDKNTLQIRSFERGHTEQSAVSSAALKAMLPLTH